MQPYTTTVEHLLPGMIVRAQDVEEGGTAVVRVLHTYVYEDGDARIGGDMLSVDVKRDTEVTVLHDPTRDEQSAQVDIKGLSDEDVEASIRRSIDQVIATHKFKGPQKYLVGGSKAGQ